MSVCSVNSPHNERPSILHSSLFRYYNVVGMPKAQANENALHNWSTTLTPEFNAIEADIITDINHEPVLFIPEETPVDDLTDQELKIKLDEGHLPVYMTTEGESITAVKRIDPVAITTDEELQRSAYTGPDTGSEPVRTSLQASALATRLAKQFNVNVEETTETAAIGMFALANREYKGEAGFRYKGKAYIVPGKVTAGVAMHEVFGHPFLDILEKGDPSMFAQFANEATGTPEVVSYIKKNYPELIRRDGTFTPSATKEAILYVIEQEANNHVTDMTNASALKRMLQMFWRWLNSKLAFITGNTEIKLNSKSTVKSLVQQVLEGKKLDLSRMDLSTEGLRRTTTGINPQEESLKAVVEPNKNVSLVRDIATNKGEYKDADNPTVAIARATEVQQNYNTSGTLYTPEQKAEYFARLEFIRNGYKSPDMGSADTIMFGEGTKRKAYTLRQLYYEELKRANWRRGYGDFSHAVMEYGRNPTPENAAKVKELAKRRVLPEDTSVVVFDGITNAENEVDSWIGPDIDGDSPHKEITERYGLDEDGGAIVKTEQIIYIREMGIATSIDLMAVYSDGTYGIIDYKFGSVSNDTLGRMFRDVDLNYTFRNKAVMEHIFHAFAIRTQNPKARFRYIDVVRMMKGDGNRVDPVPPVQLEEYLLQIKRMVANTHPELLEKYESMGLFDTNQYWSESQALKDELLKKEAELREAGELNKDTPIASQITTQLAEQIVALNAEITRMKTIKGSEGGVIKKKKTLVELTQRYLSFLNTNVSAQELFAFNSTTPKWLLDNMNKYDVKDPAVRAVITLYDQRNKILQERMDEANKVYAALFKDVFDDYKSKHASPFSAAIGGIASHKEDRTGLYDFMFIISDYLDGKSVRFISEGKDTQEWGKLTPAQKKFARYVLDTMESAYNKSVADRIIPTGANKNRTKSEALGITKRWKPDDAMVYLNMMNEEMNERPSIDQDFLGKMFKKWFVSGDFDYEINRKAGIPVKYMNQPEGMRKNMIHSMNMEHIFKRFTEHMYSVELMEDVYAVSQGVMAGIELKNATEENSTNMDTWLKYFTGQFIEGSAPKEMETTLTRIRSRKDPGVSHNVTGDRVVNGLKTFTTMTTLGLNPVLSAFNFGYTVLVEARTVVIEGMFGKMLGIKTPQHFGFKDWMVGLREAVKMAKDMAAGTQDDNVLYQFIKKYKFNPNDVMYASDPREMEYAKRKYLSKENLTILQTLGENRALVTIIGAMMHNMKIQKGNEQMSVLDAYKIVEKTHAGTGTKYKTLEWVGGKRGVIMKKGTGTAGTKPEFEEVTELTAEELNALKKGSAELTGDYRQSERSPADASILWSIFMQFKRFMRRYISNALKSYGEDTSLGHYIKTGEHVTETGEKLDTLEWQRIHTEGYLRVMAHQLLAYGVFNRRSPFRALARKLGYSDKYMDEKFGQYEWSKLNDYQKTQSLKGWVQMTFTVVSIFFLANWDDDDSPIKRRIKKALDDATDGMNPLDMVGMMKYGFPLASKSFNFFDSSFDILSSLASGDRTEAGDVRGWADFQNVFGPGQSYRSIMRIIEDAEE